MNDNNMVSVAVITYGQEKYIRQALDSILMQQVNFCYEIVVGEDCSPDNTREILREYKEKYPNKFNLILKDENVGASRNLFDVFTKCRGKYIAQLEGDDYWIDPKKLQKQVDFLESNSEYLAVSHIIELRDSEGNIYERLPEKNQADKEVMIKKYLKGITYSATATMFRNFFVENPNEYDIIFKAHRYIADLTFCMILVDKGKVFVMNDCMAVYRVKGKSERHVSYNATKTILQKYDDYIQVINENNEFFEGKYNFASWYFKCSLSTFVHSLKPYSLSAFFKTFNKVPRKYKIGFWLVLPIGLIGAVLKKIARLFKRRKTIKDNRRDYE